jgi:hypothetical protein
MTYLELQNDALTATGGSLAATSEARARVASAINFHQREILTRPLGMQLLRDRELTFTTTVDVHTYSFPASVDRIEHITSPQANQIKLALRDLAWLRAADPALTTKGNPVAYILRGRQNGLIRVQLWPTPQGAYPYTLDYEAQIADMTEDDEEPLIPLNFRRILSLGAQEEEWIKADDDRAGIARARREALEKNFARYLWDLADSSSSRPVGWSNLGGWFPADAYLRR